MLIFLVALPDGPNLAWPVVFAVADQSFLVASPCSLILPWSVVFAVADYSFLVIFSGSLIRAWLVVFVHGIWVSRFVTLLDFLDFYLGWYLTDSANYLVAVEPQRPFTMQPLHSDGF